MASTKKAPPTESPDSAFASEAVLSSPAEIDARRAQQLLERSQGMAGRGELSAAVLAARQALALAPGNAEGHAILGALLERSNDFNGASAAYQKTLQLAPDHALANQKSREMRARSDQSRGAAQQFQFNEAELYGAADPSRAKTDASAQTPAPAEVANGASQTTIIAPAATLQTTAATAAPVADTNVGDSGQEQAASALPAIEARLPPSHAAIEEALVAAQANVGAPAIAANSAPPAPTMFDPGEANPSGSPDARRRTDAARSDAARTDTARTDTARVETANVAAASALVASGETKVQARIETPSPAAPLDLSSVAGRRQADRRQVNVPVAHERRRAPSRRVSAPIVMSPAMSAPRKASAAPSLIVPLTLDVPLVANTPVWKQIAARPSFYARTLPLVGVALLSLGFLSWARGRAVSQAVAPGAPVLVSSAPGTPNMPVQNADGSVSSAPADGSEGAPRQVQGSGANNSGAFPISNQPQDFGAPSAPVAPSANSAPSSSSGSSSGSNARPAAPPRVRRLPGRAPARSNPGFPDVSLAPAPIPPAAIVPGNSGGANTGTVTSSGGNSGGGGASRGGGVFLPRPQVDLPAGGGAAGGDGRTRILPGDSLNPGGSPGRGYVRITEGRVGNGIMPNQPGATASQREQNASEAARNGQSEQAIAQLSDAIRADSDNAAYRYQKRASLFLQRGDYSRAADDFQSAIGAYQNQIARGDDVAAAQRGLAAARSGLSLALAAKRGG